MFKRSFLTACLFLILQINSNEKNLLADSLDYLNQQEVPVYRIELIIIKNLLIDEDDKQEKWPLLEEFIFSTELIELSSEPTLLVKEGFLNAKNQDTKLTFGEYPTIIGLSIGNKRNILFRKIQNKEIFNFELESGSLFIMAGSSQKYYTHEIPKNDSKEHRYSLTFRETI